MHSWRRHLWRHPPLTVVVVAVAVIASFAAFGTRSPSLNATPTPSYDQVAGLRLRGAELTSLVNSRPDPGSAAATWAATVQNHTGQLLDQARDRWGPDHPHTLMWAAVHDSVLDVARDAYQPQQLEAAISTYTTAVDRLTAHLYGVDVGPPLPPLSDNSFPDQEQP